MPNNNQELELSLSVLVRFPALGALDAKLGRADQLLTYNGVDGSLPVSKPRPEMNRRQLKTCNELECKQRCSGGRSNSLRQSNVE